MEEFCTMIILSQLSQLQHQPHQLCSQPPSLPVFLLHRLFSQVFVQLQCQAIIRALCHTIADAARNNHLNCVEYAHSHGCPWSENAPAGAATHGYLDIIQFCYTHKCPWNEHTCNNAAHGGHLNCLQYDISTVARGAPKHALLQHLVAIWSA